MLIELLRSDPRLYFALVLALVVSICLHELAHGIVAVKHGDRTPIEQERITLNPLVHMGALSLVVLLIAGMAWGAMPIDRARLRGRYAEAHVAMAGPLMNLCIAAATLTALGLWQRHYPLASSAHLSDFASNGRLLLRVFGVTNVALALFNLIPVPPLDGSHVLANLSPSYGRSMELISMTGGSFAMMAMVFMFAGRFIFPAAGAIADRYQFWVRGW
jgi:Zn-dependent protease